MDSKLAAFKSAYMALVCVGIWQGDDDQMILHRFVHDALTKPNTKMQVSFIKLFRTEHTTPHHFTNFI